MKRFLVLLLLFLFDCSVSAEVPRLEVNGVTVKVTDRNSLAAKQKALSNSMYRAFNRLLDSYFPEAVSLKNTIQEEKIQDCIYDYSIDQEKFSGKTYIARFSFRFSKDSVQKMLRNHNIRAYEERKSKTETIAIYLEDYMIYHKMLGEYLSDYKVILFSPKRVVLKIPAASLLNLSKLKISFEKINAEIHS